MKYTLRLSGGRIVWPVGLWKSRYEWNCDHAGRAATVYTETEKQQFYRPFLGGRAAIALTYLPCVTLSKSTCLRFWIHCSDSIVCKNKRRGGLLKELDSFSQTNKFLSSCYLICMSRWFSSAVIVSFCPEPFRPCYCTNVPA